MLYFDANRNGRDLAIAFRSGEVLIQSDPISQKVTNLIFQIILRDYSLGRSDLQY
jgi:hypothetical protein